MAKLLIVVDMQNDFITGSLGSPRAEQIVANVKTKIAAYKQNDDTVVFTRDTHDTNYLSTQEGRMLPVIHCVVGTEGRLIAKELEPEGCLVIDKPNFGALTLAEQIAAEQYDEIELCGLCTDICVVTNALILKTQLPEMKLTVDAACCAGVTEESHKAALLTMKMCQVNIMNA